MNATTKLTHGWVNSPDGRGTIDIIWSCLVTIFLCSWSVLFLNVPRKPGQRHFLATKLLWVAFTIFLPEVSAAFAQQQWISAYQSVSDFSQAGYSQWSFRHAFFADMGGFMLVCPDYVPFPVDAHHIYYLVTHGFMVFPDIEKKAIWDKNKADGFARLLTSIQVCGFALQCLGRAMQRLPISTLELSTVTFVFCTLPTFFWWRHKPLDVATTITIYLKDQDTIKDVLQSAGTRACRPFRSTPLDFVNPRHSQFDFLGPVVWGSDLLFGLGGAPKYGPITSFRNSIRKPPRGARVLDWVVISTISLIYMGLYFIAWNWAFSTALEHNSGAPQL